MNIFRLGLIILTISLLNSCGDATTDLDSTDLSQENKKTENDSTKKVLINYSRFTMPPPVDLFISMYELGSNFSKEAVNSPDNLKNYNTTVRKAIGLGAFSSDLSYTSVFGQNQLTMNYFSVSKKLADDLGLTEGFDQEIVQRINDNLSNADSLYHITKDSYSDAIIQVNNSDQAYLLPYIAFGGWIESVYIAAVAGDVTKSDKVSLNTVSEQGIFLENLIDYYDYILKAELENNEAKGVNKKNKEDVNPDIQSILADLQTIYVLYNDALNSDDITLSEEQFEIIKDKIIVIREKWLM